MEAAAITESAAMSASAHMVSMESTVNRISTGASRTFVKTVLAVHSQEVTSHAAARLGGWGKYVMCLKYLAYRPVLLVLCVKMVAHASMHRLAISANAHLGMLVPTARQTSTNAPRTRVTTEVLVKI